MGKAGTPYKPAEVEIDGRMVPLHELARTTGMPYRVLYSRLIHNRWSLARALAEPVRKANRRGYSYDVRDNPLLKQAKRES